MKQSLKGVVERVTFHTEDTGYSVLKVRIGSRVELVTVTGRAPAVHEGEGVEAEGEWVNVPNYGRQFRAEVLTITEPASKAGLVKYLGSGLIEGIGPVYAKKLVEKFGERIFDVIEGESKRLEEVEGIGSKRRQEIKRSWEKQKSIREIMLFLHQHGISTAKAVKIYQQYGENAITTVRTNPYQLARDIYGIGFKSADSIAQKVGLAREAPERIQAGISHALIAAGDDGHCALPTPELVQKATEMLGVPATLVEAQLEAMIQEGKVVRETHEETQLIFPPHLAVAERDIAAHMRFFARQPVLYPAIDVEKALEWVQGETKKQLAPGQAEAIRAALRSRVLIITGGPGVGKTTILNSLLKILRAKAVKCVLAAPTGRAARRMSESTGLRAKTIHRLLEYQPGKGWARNAENPLEGNLFVLDETSMVDVPLFANYLRALPKDAHLLLVGDADQLPSVGPGNLLRDLIASGAIPVARLTEIFRQAAESQIILAAHAINGGRLPQMPEQPNPQNDFFFIERDSPEAILETMLHLARNRMPAAFGLDPIRDIQILSPMNRTPLGTANLNAQLQEALNPWNEFKAECERYGLKFRVGDKVIQIRNNYDKDAFNGDIGFITAITPDPLQVEVRFDEDRLVSYQTAEMDELRLAYAITIHKSQGSEFPAVIIPVSTQHFVMLQRNLFYTGLTRGKTRVVFVGDKKALAMAVRNAQGGKRWSGLHARLTSG